VKGPEGVLAQGKEVCSGCGYWKALKTVMVIAANTRRVRSQEATIGGREGWGGVVNNEPVSERRRSAKGGKDTQEGKGLWKGKKQSSRIKRREGSREGKDQEKGRCDLSSRPFRESGGEAAQHIREGS